MLETIVVNVTEVVETVKVSATEIVEEVFVQIAGTKITKEFRQEWVEPYDYIGKAEKESMETAAVWKVYRVKVNPDGSVEIKKAFPIKWSERLTETYI